MPNKRMGRITEDIKRELTDIFRTLKDPRIAALSTIVRVEVTGDLSYATVYVSAFGEHAEETVAGLRSAAGYIRRELGRRLQLRKTPELRFVADSSIAHGAQIAAMLHAIEEEQEKGQPQREEEEQA